MPNLAFLDDAQCARVIQFVENGGRLLVIGQTATLDGWGRRRTDFGLRAVLPDTVRMPGLVFDQHVASANDPVTPGRPAVGDKDHWARHQAGAGRVVYIPALVNPATQPSLFNADNTYNLGLDLTNWRVPEKAKELREALAWLLDDRPTFAVQAERGLLANYYRQRATSRCDAHLVNLHDQPVHHLDRIDARFVLIAMALVGRRRADGGGSAACPAPAVIPSRQLLARQPRQQRWVSRL